MKSFIPGLFTSKLLYALPLVSSVWNLSLYTGQEPNKLAFTKGDMARLQSLQNQAAKLLHERETLQLNHPTATLLADIGWLSVHQLTAYTILLQLAKILQHGTPAYIFNMITFNTSSRTNEGSIVIPRCMLNIQQEDFFNQASRLFNMLPKHLKNQMRDKETLKSVLKNSLREWTRTNISVKP